ncbi:ABC transporter substrate-binding protein, partial [Bifidobacterium pullorum subsp. saeculare]|nr:ABC transporter substrate-binding protein [Bifidobacterium pullorum subsp. saeculare]
MLTAAMLLSGCGSSSGSNGSSASSEGGNVITAYASEPQKTFIPGNINETGGGKPADMMFARLVSFDDNGKASNEIAESVTPNENATEYTIKLKDWKFSNGDPVKAENFTKA